MSRFDRTSGESKENFEDIDTEIINKVVYPENFDV
jgi:hypothetical protein